MREKIKIYWEKVGPMQGVLIFMLVLLSANLVWKLSVSGEDGSNQVLLFNTFDISGPFDFMVVHITKVAKMLFAFSGFHVHSHFANQVCFENHNYLLIIWGCTAIKQSFIFLCIMVFTQGPWKHKLWFVPLGLLLVYAFNIFRIYVIAIIVWKNPERFDFFHEIIKYAFYGVIFLYWVIWEEKMNPKRKLLLKK